MERECLQRLHIEDVKVNDAYLCELQPFYSLTSLIKQIEIARGAGSFTLLATGTHTLREVSFPVKSDDQCQTVVPSNVRAVSDFAKTHVHIPLNAAYPCQIEARVAISYLQLQDAD